MEKIQPEKIGLSVSLDTHRTFALDDKSYEKHLDVPLSAVSTKNSGLSQPRKHSRHFKFQNVQKSTFGNHGRDLVELWMIRCQQQVLVCAAGLLIKEGYNRRPQ